MDSVCVYVKGTRGIFTNTKHTQFPEFQDLLMSGYIVLLLFVCVVSCVYTSCHDVCTESRCLLKPKLGVRTAIVHPSINHFLEVLFEFAYSKTSCFLILDSRVSKLERLDIRDARIKFRGSS